MEEETSDHESSDPVMDQRGAFISAKNPAEFLAPRGVDIQAAKACGRLNKKSDHEDKVRRTIYDAEAFNKCRHSSLPFFFFVMNSSRNPTRKLCGM